MMQKNVEAVLNGLNVAVFVVNAEHEILFRNDSSARLFGTGILGRKLENLVPQKRVLNAVDKVLSGAAKHSVGVKVQLVVPTSFDVTIVRMAPDVKRKDAKAIVSFEDVNHIREAEQMRSDFVANVSHELRSPLTALYGFIETLQGPAKGDTVANERFLSLMENEAKRMARLIDDLLSLSKLEVVERRAPTELVDVVAMLHRVVATLEPISMSEQKDIRLHITEPLPIVHGAVDELTQVFGNLIENAIKYGKIGSTVIVSAGIGSEHPDMLAITVADQSEGIAAKHIPRLTQRFYRIDKGRSRAKGGTGLGLAIVKHILVRHRGKLQIKSDLGIGSEFTVLLPLVPKGA